MTITDQIMRAVKRNPKINRVIVTRTEFDLIHDEFRALSLREIPRTIEIDGIYIGGVPLVVR